MSSSLLEFVPISSSINPSFWNKLSEIKLNIDKLNETEHPIWGYFSHINNLCEVPILEVNSTSFNTNFESQRIYIPFHGKILNKNTIEQFKDSDKTRIINDVGQAVLRSIENSEALMNPSLLNQFFVLSYVDLKKFHFYYWFAFPVPHNLSITCNNVKKISDVFSVNQQQELWEKYCELENYQKPYFFVYLENTSINIVELKSKIRSLNEENYSDYYFAFYDLSLQDKCPGSTLRNYVALILHECPFLGGKSVNFLSLRLKRSDDSILTISHSLILNLELPFCQPSLSDFINRDNYKGWVGWEKNERGKMGPRLSNMKSSMDPKELAESSVDLNLKLMKWRLLSNIDLEKIKHTNFLLLGSGTLGCSVARILLGWGARNISFVDNSVVSYSNPVRQSLFTFEDSKNAKLKSHAAAENLRKIFPGVKSKSFQLTIPMPGHSIGESMLDEVKKNVETLTSLIQDHEVIFLLMDSRESRWLPTLLGSYFKKTVINAALGFDSFLVMRHGVRVHLDELKVRQHPPGFKSLKGNYLGCYFCNDVTAPGNSMKDRTLDQQCTVTRPGVSAIAGALSAELAISILQHKEGAKAAAFYQIGNVANTQNEIDNQCILGLIPHSIRGYLSTFSQVLPATERYKLCVACSDIVQDAYGKDGFNFLLEVFQNSKHLEDITGLSNLNKAAEDIGIWEFSDEEEVECTNYADENETETVSKMSDTSVEVNNSRGEVIVEYHTYSNINEYEEIAGGVEMKSSNDTIDVKSTISGELNDLQSTIMKNIAAAEMKGDSSTSKITEISLDSLPDADKLTAAIGDQKVSSQSFANSSNSDFLNCILSKNIETILERKNIISSAESLIMGAKIVQDKIKSLTGLGNTDLDTKYSSVHEQSQLMSQRDMSSSSNIDLVTEKGLSKNISDITTEIKLIPSQDVSTVKQNLLSSSAISSDNTTISNFSVNRDIPDELLPILEKQKAVSSARFIINKPMHSRFNDDIISLKSRMKNFISSQSIILKTEEQSHEDSSILHLRGTQNEDIDAKISHASLCEDKLENEKGEYENLGLSNQSETIYGTDMRMMENKLFIHSLKDNESKKMDIITITSKIGSVISSDSVHSTDSEYRESLPNEKVKFSILDHLKKRKELLTIIARNLITSSESLSSNEVISEQEDKHEYISEQARPHDVMNSIALDSNNLKLDESVYYLAKTDSNTSLAD